MARLMVKSIFRASMSVAVLSDHYCILIMPRSHADELLSSWGTYAGEICLNTKSAGRIFLHVGISRSDKQKNPLALLLSGRERVTKPSGLSCILVIPPRRSTRQTFSVKMVGDEHGFNVDSVSCCNE